MKKIFTILAVIAAAFAITLAVLPISNFAVFPGVAAFVFGLIAYNISKKTGQVEKLIPFALLLTLMALCLSGYKAFFTETKIENTEVLEATQTKLEEEAIEELENLDIEIDIDEIEIDDSALEEISVQ